LYGKIFATVRESMGWMGAASGRVNTNSRGENMPGSEWIYLGVFLLLAPVFPAAALLIPRVIAPRKPNPIKSQTYECGMETVGETWVQFRVQYYIFALVFLVFDVETVFLFPWAVAFDQLPLFAVVEAFVFIGILVVGLVYAWRKGALKWI
jgi:NADH:ubiquinone oxidoreductase subunit 3 (subunit A)